MAQTDVRGLRAAIYLRKSRADLDDESKGHGDTLARHRETLLALADRLHVAVGKIYPEVVSGETIASRPQMQALLHDLEAGLWDAVLVMEVPRLTRGSQIKIYPEVVSGETIASRPQMQALLHDLEAGLWDAVLVMEVPRLTRGSQIDQGIIANAFKYTHTLIITPEKIYDPNDSADEDMLDFGMFFSRFEWKAINKRQQAGRRASSKEGKYIGSIPPYGGRRASSKEGKYIGSIPPYGYQRQKLPHEKGWTLVPDPETAPIVQRIFNLLTESQIPQHAIAMQLNAEGIPSPRGCEWKVSTVQRLVKNIHYAGYITSSYRPIVKSMQDGAVTVSRPVNREIKLFPGRHEALVSPEQFRAGYITSSYRPIVKSMQDGAVTVSRPVNREIKLFPGRHEALVSPEQFRKAAALLAQNKRPPVPHIHGLNNPLSGLVVCSACGKRMQRRNQTSGPSQILCTTRGCPTVASNVEEVTDLVLQAMAQWLQKFELSSGSLEDFLPNIGEKRRRLDAIERSLKKLKAREDRAFELAQSKEAQSSRRSRF